MVPEQLTAAADLTAPHPEIPVTQAETADTQAVTAEVVTHPLLAAAEAAEAVTLAAAAAEEAAIHQVAAHAAVAHLQEDKTKNK